MTVKELINELLECDMDSDVTIKIKFADIDLEYEEIKFEILKTGGSWGKNTPCLSVDLEDVTSQKFAEGFLD